MDVAYSVSGQLQEALVCGRQDFSVAVTFSLKNLFSPKGPTLQLSDIGEKSNLSQTEENVGGSE